jgi:hypothetical protein
MFVFAILLFGLEFQLFSFIRFVIFVKEFILYLRINQQMFYRFSFKRLFFEID